MLLTGQVAGAISALVLLALGARRGRARAPVDAISHWVWPWRAYWQPGRAVRPVWTGLAIHQAASVLWAGVHAGWRGRHCASQTDAAALGAGLVVAALAAFVDLRLTPRRFTPGFEHQLARRELALVYAAFGLALACRDLARRDESGP